jgi:hypothetical protein
VSDAWAFTRRRGGCTFDKLTADDSIPSYLLMAWVGDTPFSLAQWMVAGFTINCPESDTVMTDLREIGPTYSFRAAALFETLLTQVMIRWRMQARSSGAPSLHGGRPPLRRRNPDGKVGIASPIHCNTRSATSPCMARCNVSA